MSESQRFQTQWGDKTLTIEVGLYANQAGGSCTVQYGDTVILATAVMSSYKREGLHFFPLMVDFEENLYAAGRIKGSRFMKRGGRPTDEAVLTARMIDRGMRPLFDDSIRNDIQVIITNMAYDDENESDVLGIIGASCALAMSDIPWAGPIAGVRVGQVDGKLVLNPTNKQREESSIDLVFSGTPQMIIMVEGSGKEVSEELVLEAFAFGQKNLAAPMKLIADVVKAVGKEKRDMSADASEDSAAEQEARERVEALALPFIKENIQKLFFETPQATKGERGAQKEELKELTKTFLIEKEVEEDHLGYGLAIVHDVLESEVHRSIVEDDRRIDGRGLDEIRELVSEVAMLPRVHGTGHFKRGETQVLTTVTLGSPGDEQLLDGQRIVGKKRYFHHYNFPPYSVGEVKPLRGPSRRDIGHGGLAEKALLPMLPDKEAFPYTIQTSSTVFGSNGSSSMASTCGSSLALMDAGVPIKAAVAGLAMGLASYDGKWKIIADLQDLEDGKGGMDFKIAGSRAGITAIQMDTKTAGLAKDIVDETFAKAKVARMQILDVMDKAIAEPRADLSPYAPRIISLRIDPERIGDVIGPGGKTINGIIEETGVGSIDIEDDGLVMITSTDAEGAEKAKEIIVNLTREIKAGETFKGKVTRVMDFGAIVEFMPKKDGMVHVSEMAPWRVEKVSDIVKLGDEVFVKVLEISEGRTSLSMKQAEGNVYPEKPPAASATSSRPPSRGPRPGGSGGHTRGRTSSREPRRDA